jgi:hypothetical protein
VEVLKHHENINVSESDKAKPGRGRIRSLTLPAVRLSDLQKPKLPLLLSKMGHDRLYKSDSGTIYIYSIQDTLFELVSCKC